jgi:hypothetical protein
VAQQPKGDRSMSNELMPCDLSGKTGKCKATRIGDSMLFQCGECGNVCRPVLGLATQQKLLDQPEHIRRLVAALLTSPNADDRPFVAYMVSGWARWGLHGVGRTKEYPTEITLRQDDEDATVIIRWGELDRQIPGEWDVAPSGPIVAVKESQLFQRLSTTFGAAGMNFIGLEPVGHHLFGGRFKDEAFTNECGIIAMLRYKWHESVKAGLSRKGTQ